MTLTDGGTRHSGRFVCPAGVLLLVVVGIAAGAQAAEFEVGGTATYRNATTIPSGGYDDYVITVSATADMRYRVRLTVGNETDVYLMTLQQRQQYVNALNGSTVPFDYLMRNERTRDISRDQYPAGTYYLVIDNTPIPGGGAIPSGPISYEVTVTFTQEPTFDFGSFLLLSAILVVIVVIVGALHAASSVKEARRHHEEWKRIRVKDAEERAWRQTLRSRAPRPGGRTASDDPFAPAADDDYEQSPEGGEDEAYEPLLPAGSPLDPIPPGPSRAPPPRRRPGEIAQRRYPQIPRRERSAHPGFITRQQARTPAPRSGELEVGCTICGTQFVAEELVRPFETQCPACGHWERLE